jgi:hypothetical protein
MRTQTAAAVRADDAELHHVISELSQILQETGLQRTLAIGRLVLDRFFHGSAQAWRDRRRNKNNSVRRLADCVECPLSRSALNQAIGVYALVQTLPSPEQLEALGASHFSLVLPLPPHEQEHWLRCASAERWSVRELRQELLEARRAQGERRGRPRLSGLDKALAQLRSCTGQLEIAVVALAELGPTHSSDEMLLEVSGRLKAIEDKLGELRQAARRDSGVMMKAKPDPLAASEQLKVG